MQITRRHVLATGAAMSAAVGLGAGNVAFRWWDQPAGEGLQVLSRDEFAFVQALAEAWKPAGGTPALSGAEANIGHFVDAAVANMPPFDAKGMRLLMQVLDDLPMLGRLTPYRNLSLRMRQEILAAWIESPTYYLRMGVMGIMVFISFGWTLHPKVSPVLGRSFGCGYSV